MQDTATPLVQGFGSAAASLASVNWSEAFGSGGGTDTSYYGTGGKYGEFVPPTQTASGNYTFGG